jgi:hypothetical protein
MSTTEVARLKGRYRSEIAPALKSQFGYKNVMQIPTLTKIVVNMGVGEAARDAKLIEGAIRDLTTITGQKPQVTKSRKSIAQFKLRENMPIGAHVTLRATVCGSSQTVSYQSLCLVSATSVGFHQSSSMAMATTPLASPSKLCSLRFNKTKLIVRAVWISPLLLPRRTMKKVAHSLRRSAFLLGRTNG